MHAKFFLTLGQRGTEYPLLSVHFANSVKVTKLLQDMHLTFEYYDPDSNHNFGNQ